MGFHMRRLRMLLLLVLAGSFAGCYYYAPGPSYAPPPAPSYGYPPAPPSGPPDMVWLPSPGVYVGMGFSYPLFFDGGTYYSNYGGRWYSGSSYRGPWNNRPGPPPSLHGFQPKAWGGYQEQARGYYQSNPNWKHFKPTH